MARWTPVVILGAATAIAWFFTTPKGASLYKRFTTSSRCDTNDKRKLIAVLREITRAFHTILTELAHMKVTVEKQIQGKGLSNVVSDRELITALMQQGFKSRLTAAQNAAFKAHGMDEPTFTALSKDLDDDPEVKVYTNGIEQMLDDTMAGKPPLLPNAKLPDKLKSDPTLVLEILGAMKRKKAELFQGILAAATREELAISETTPGGLKLPTAELNAKLAAAADLSEEIVFKERVAELGVPDLETFKHALALHTRETEGFALKRSILEEVAGDEVVRLMKEALDRVATNPPLPTNTVLDEVIRDSEREGTRLVIAVGDYMEESFVTVGMDDIKRCAALQGIYISERDLPCYICLSNGRVIRIVKTSDEALAFLDEVTHKEAQSSVANAPVESAVAEPPVANDHVESAVAEPPVAIDPVRSAVAEPPVANAPVESAVAEPPMADAPVESAAVSGSIESALADESAVANPATAAEDTTTPPIDNPSPSEVKTPGDPPKDESPPDESFGDCY